MGHWTQVSLEVITSNPLPENFFGKELHDKHLPWNMPIEEKAKVWAKEKAMWDYAYAHEDEFLPIGEGDTLSYIKESVYYPYKLCGEPMMAYRTVIAGAINEYVEEDVIEWFKNKCKSIGFPCTVLYINARANGIITVKYVVNEDFVLPQPACFDDDGDLDESEVPYLPYMGNLHYRRKQMIADKREKKLFCLRKHYLKIKSK